MISNLSAIVTMSLSWIVPEILSLIYQNLNTSRDRDYIRPLKGQYVIPMLNHRMANQCTKFEASSFSHSGEILG